MTDVYELSSSNHLFVGEIKKLVRQGQLKQAGQLANELQIGEAIDFDVLPLPLLLQGKQGIFEDIIKQTRKFQIEAVMFLDTLIPEGRLQTFLKQINISNIKTSQFEFKPLNTLIKRFLKTFNLEPSLAPNYMKCARTKRLKFLLKHHYESNNTCRTSFEDNIALFIRENDPVVKQELVQYCVQLGKLDDAAFFMIKYGVPIETVPPELVAFIRSDCVMTPSLDSRESVLASLANKSSGSSNVSSDDENESSKFHQLKIPNENIFMVDSLLAFWSMLYKFHCDKPKIIGIDTEHTLTSLASIIQIAFNEFVFIIDVLTLVKIHASEDCWKWLCDNIINNSDILKVGFELNLDFDVIRKSTSMDIKFDTETCIDLKIVAATILKNKNPFIFPFQDPDTVSNLSLTKLTKFCFGKKLDKSNVLSVWTQRPLRPEQIAYAALDAFVLLEILDFMLTLQFK